MNISSVTLEYNIILYLGLCSNLPELGKFISQWNDATTAKGSCVPATAAHAQELRQSFKGLLNDIDITSKVC